MSEDQTTKPDLSNVFGSYKRCTSLLPCPHKEEVERLQKENEQLRYMIELGLGWEDIKIHVTYPNG